MVLFSFQQNQNFVFKKIKDIHLSFYFVPESCSITSQPDTSNVEASALILNRKGRKKYVQDN